MRKPIALASLLLLAAPVLAEDLGPAAATIPAPAAAVAAPAATPRAPRTLAGVGRHATRTITALMRSLALSRIPAERRAELNDRLLAVQAQVASAVDAGRPPAGEDVDGFAARLGKDLDAVAGAIDAASRRAP